MARERERERDYMHDMGYMSYIPGGLSAYVVDYLTHYVRVCSHYKLKASNL